MNSPTMLYRAPGPEKIHGHDVEFTIVDELQVEEQKAAGWFSSAIEAGEAWLKAEAEKAKKVVEEIEDKAAATREEVIQKLEELEVGFKRSLGTPKLLALLEDEIKKRAAAPVPPPAPTPAPTPGPVADPAPQA